MAKLLGIDHGDARIGIAIADTEIGIAHPHRVLASGRKAIEEIRRIIEYNGISLVIVGLPRSMDGSERIQAGKVREFAGKLKEAVEVEIVFQDERLTSVQAEDVLIRMGKSRDERKALADAHQAAVILQTYIDSVTNGDGDWDS